MQVTWQTTDSGFAPQPKRYAQGMVISRKDTVIIAVLINIALLAFLFATANREVTQVPLQREKSTEKAVHTIVKKQELAPQKEIAVFQEPDTSVLPVDEIDEILQKYLDRQTSDRQVVVQEDRGVQKKKEKQEKASPVVSKKIIAPLHDVKKDTSLQIAVKEGDMLSKLAKRYGVSVASIVALNQLENDALTIGQKLYIPQDNPQKAREESSSEKIQPLYYTVKKGDSPWSIARKFDIELDAFLKINELNQEEAKNLRVGQKIRIR